MASLRNPAEPFSGVPESSSMTSSIFRPPRTPPRAFTSSAPILAPRTMNCPAAASPGGERGVRTPIFTGFWARAGEVSPTTSSAVNRANRTRPVIVILRGKAGYGAERPSCYAGRAVGVNTAVARVEDVERVADVERLADPSRHSRPRVEDQTRVPMVGAQGVHRINQALQARRALPAGPGRPVVGIAARRRPVAGPDSPLREQRDGAGDRAG